MFGLDWIVGTGLKALVSFFVGIFKDWRRDMELKDKGAREQAERERAELDRQIAVTEEEDEKARTDTDAALDDELRRPL